ncbi:hypothetical protein ACH4OW_23895 [Streptomyces sp. NPDC017056]|uniref:hypothetical protein n=1 Tax=Streptomyces sp. NPDC017056 TaxID=3364973 RepID=UPI0037A7BB5E
MKTGNGPLDDALAAGERSAHHVTRLGGRDMSPQVESWSLDRSYGSDLPDTMRAFSGVSSAQLDVSVTGAGGQSAPALYGPWAPRETADVARPGQSVTHEWGVTGRAADAFRGSVRSRSAESGTDLVRITALDGAERLRQPAELPRPDGSFTSPAESWTPWAASPEWVVDHLLRTAGIHTAPPPRPTSILYVPLHGGAAAGIGYLERMTGKWSLWGKRAAPFDTALWANYPTPATGTYVPKRLPVTNSVRGLYFECWVNTSESFNEWDSLLEFQTVWEVSPSAPKNYLTLRVNFLKGAITAHNGMDPDPTKNASVGWTWSALRVPGKFHIGLWLEISDYGAATFTPIVTTRSMVPEVFTPGIFNRARVLPGAMVNVSLSAQNLLAEAFQVSQPGRRPTSLAEVTQEGTWKRTASLDMPQFPLRTIPAVSGSAWGVITEIARATLSTAEFDSDGYFRWRNYTRWATPASAPDITVTTARDIAKLTVTEEIDACRNYCTVKWEDWAPVKAVPIDLRDEPAPITIAPKATLQRTFTVSETMLDPRAPRTADLDDAKQWNRISLRVGSAGSSAPAAGVVEVGVSRSGGVVTLTATNYSDSTVYYHGAVLLCMEPAEYARPVPAQWNAWNTDSQKYHGVQTYEHDVRGWVQDNASGQLLAEALRNAGAWPIPLLQSVEILPDPRIELGDLVRVVDTTGAKLDTLAWVIGNRVSASGGKVTQTLTLRGTQPNGIPSDAGLTPDPPTRPNAPPPP